MLPKPLRALWGDLTIPEIKRFGVLALIITLILGNYWMTRVMKNAIFRDFVNVQSLPLAKIVSLIAMVFIVSGYSKLVDLFEKHKLFYLLSALYAIVFIILGCSLWVPEMFMLPENSALMPYFSWIPGRLMGWVSYVAIESSSLLIILFWAFVASVTSIESAKKGYPMIVSCIQLGTILSTSMVSVLAQKLGLVRLMFAASVPCIIIPFIVYYYITFVPKDENITVVSEKKKNQVL